MEEENVTEFIKELSDDNLLNLECQNICTAQDDDENQTLKL